MSFLKNELIQVFQTLSAHWLDLVAPLGLYIPRKWWKFEQCWSILIIFEDFAMDNPRKMDFCGHPYAIGLIEEPLQSRTPWENGKNSSDFCPFWSFLKVIRKTTLLSWVSVGNMNWVESRLHPYAIGLTQEPLWSRIPTKLVKIGEISVHFDHFLRVMWRKTLLSWVSVKDMDWAEYPKHSHTIGLIWKLLRGCILRENFRDSSNSDQNSIQNYYDYKQHE